MLYQCWLCYCSHRNIFNKLDDTFCIQNSNAVCLGTSLQTERLVAPEIVWPLPLWKLEAGSWLTQVLMHLSVQRNGCKYHRFDWIGLFWQLLFMSFLLPHSWAFHSLDFKILVKGKSYCNSWMSFAVIAIIIIQLLTSESFLVKLIRHCSTMKYLQENTSALRQSFHWVCSSHASVKVLKTLQVALRAVSFLSCPNNFLLLNLISFYQSDLPGAPTYTSLFISH